MAIKCSLPLQLYYKEVFNFIRFSNNFRNVFQKAMQKLEY